MRKPKVFPLGSNVFDLGEFKADTLELLMEETNDGKCINLIPVSKGTALCIMKFPLALFKELNEKTNTAWHYLLMENADTTNLTEFKKK